MTPVEALECAVTQMFDSKEMAESDYDLAGVFVTRALRVLGFTVVPIEPTDAQVEAMAREMCPGDQSWWTIWTGDARAAYAAAVKETRYD